MRRFSWRRSLFARLLSYFLLLAVIPVALVGAMAYYQGQQSLRNNVLDQLTSTATLKEGEISRWVEATTGDVQLLAQVPMVQENAQVLLTADRRSPEFAAAYQALQTYIQGLVANKPDFLEAQILKGVGGQVLLSTDPAHEGSYEVTSSFFTEGRKGLYLQNVYPSASLGKPAMTVALPLRDGAGEALGVLAVHLNLDRLDQIMLERGGLGETGETYLVDQYNVFVSQARAGGESFPRGVHTVGIDRALLNQADGTGIYDNYRGLPVFGAYRWLDNQKMALLAEIEVDEALAPVRRLARTMGIVGVVVALLVGLASYGVTRQIVRPVRALTETATRMAGGDLSQRAGLKQLDEIGALSQAFDGMADQLQGLIGTLEQRVADRTGELERRAVQLSTAAEVGRAATSILDPDKLAQQTVDLLRERFDLYYAGLFLLDKEGEYAVLEAGTGEAGRIMKERGHKLEVGGTSMVGSACAQREARIALDVGAEPVRFANPLLPETRSEMALPLRVGERVLGALDAQSTRPAAFTQEDIAVMQLAADQVAVAIDNARKFSTEAAMLEATSPLFAVSRRLSEAITTDQVTQVIVDSVAETEADGCAVARFAFSPGAEKDRVETITFLRSWSRTGESRFPVGTPLPAGAATGNHPERSEWAIPVEMMKHFSVITDTDDSSESTPSRRDGSQAEDEVSYRGVSDVMKQAGVRAVVNVPLQTGGRVIGVVIVQRATPGPFSPVSVRLYETLVEQAAVALERTRLVEEAERRAVQEQWLGQMSDQMQRAGDMGSLLRIAAEGLRERLNASRSTVRLGVSAGEATEGSPGTIPERGRVDHRERASESGGDGDREQVA